MTYEEFRKVYTEAFNSMMKYAPDQVGSGFHANKSGFYANEMMELEETYPLFAERAENEL